MLAGATVERKKEKRTDTHAHLHAFLMHSSYMAPRHLDTGVSGISALVGFLYSVAGLSLFPSIVVAVAVAVEVAEAVVVTLVVVVLVVVALVVVALIVVAQVVVVAAVLLVVVAAQSTRSGGVGAVKKRF